MTTVLVIVGILAILAVALYYIIISRKEQKEGEKTSDVMLKAKLKNYLIPTLKRFITIQKKKLETAEESEKQLILSSIDNMEEDLEIFQTYLDGFDHLSKADKANIRGVIYLSDYKI